MHLRFFVVAFCIGCGGSTSDGTSRTPGAGGSSSSLAGTEGHACYPNDTCNAGLSCLSHLCVKAGSGGGGSTGSGGATASGGASDASVESGAGGTTGKGGGSSTGGSSTGGSSTGGAPRDSGVEGLDGSVAADSGTGGDGATACTTIADCTTGFCDAAVHLCVPCVDALPCDDGNGCTVGDTCQAGQCVGAARDCAQELRTGTNGPGSGNDCVATAQCYGFSGATPDHSCVASTYKANGAPCEDGNACTFGDTCSGSAGSSTCGAGVYCPGTGDVYGCQGLCTKAGCDYSVVAGLSCKTSKCFTGEQCDGTGTCAGGTPVSCASNAGSCYSTTCDPVLGCAAYAAVGTSCVGSFSCTTFGFSGSAHCGQYGTCVYNASGGPGTAGCW